MHRTKWKQRIGAAVIAIGGTWAGATVMAGANTATASPATTSTATTSTATADNSAATAITDSASIGTQPTAQTVTVESHSHSGGS